MLCVPSRLAPKERKVLNNFDKSNFESVWLECHCNFSKDCRSQMLLTLTYNPLKAIQIEFVEQLLNNIENATCESLPIDMMVNYNFDFFRTLEREILETVILPYSFSVSGPTLPTRICETTKTHIDYILTESIPGGKCFVSDCPFKTNRFCFAVFTDKIF